MEHVSVFRLRLGAVLIGIWWIPVWLLAPLVAHFVDRPVGSLTIAIAIVQTIIGVIGALVAGRQAAKIVRHTPFRAVPGKIWHVLWTGRLIEPEPTEATGRPNGRLPPDHEREGRQDSRSRLGQYRE